MQDQEAINIAEFIVETCLNSPTPEVLGTSLAAIVKARFPTVNLKSKYGGLGGFVKDYCSRDIDFHGRRGLDLVYVHASRLSEIPADTHVATAPKDTPWIAFSNPSSSNRLFMKQDASAMLVVRPENPTPDGYVEVPKVTEQEYREIAKEFIADLSLPEQTEYGDIVAKPGFWFPFVNLVKERQGQQGNDNLVKLRLTRLNELLEKRLRSLAPLSSAELQRACRLVKAKSQQTHPMTRPDLLSRKKNHDEERLPLLDGAFTRRLALSAIELMSVDELRQIRLPLGVMADAFRKLR